MKLGSWIFSGNSGNLNENAIPIYKNKYKWTHTHTYVWGQQAMIHSPFLHGPGMFFISLKGYFLKRRKQRICSRDRM